MGIIKENIRIGTFLFYLMGKLYNNVKALTRCRCYLSATLPDWSLATLSLHCSLAHSPRVSLSHYTRLSLSDLTRDLCLLASPHAGGRTYIQDRGLSWRKRERGYTFIGAGHRGVYGISPKGNEDPAALPGNFLRYV